jgi:hypothetical protein
MLVDNCDFIEENFQYEEVRALHYVHALIENSSRSKNDPAGGGTRADLDEIHAVDTLIEKGFLYQSADDETPLGITPLGLFTLTLPSCASMGICVFLYLVHVSGDAAMLAMLGLAFCPRHSRRAGWKHDSDFDRGSRVFFLWMCLMRSELNTIDSYVQNALHQDDRPVRVCKGDSKLLETMFLWPSVCVTKNLYMGLGSCRLSLDHLRRGQLYPKCSCLQYASRDQRHGRTR